MGEKLHRWSLAEGEEVPHLRAEALRLELIRLLFTTSLQNSKAKLKRQQEEGEEDKQGEGGRAITHSYDMIERHHGKSFIIALSCMSNTSSGPATMENFGIAPLWNIRRFR